MRQTTARAISSATQRAVSRARQERGRAWDQNDDRCLTCTFWDGPVVNDLWRSCERHKTLTRDDGGCAGHLPAKRETENMERDIAIVASVVGGKSYRKVGAEHGISGQRVEQIVRKAQELGRTCLSARTTET